MLQLVSSTPSVPRHTQIVENLRRRQLAWIEAMVKATGLTRTEIARRARVSPSTISKFENDVDNIAQLEQVTVEKLSLASGVDFWTYDADHPRLGLHEGEARPFLQDGYDDAIARAVDAFRAGGNAVDAWQLRSSALELAGYLPGDVLLVDLNAKPEDGDVVCAQVYDRFGRAETQFRLFQRPFVVAASISRDAFRPQIVDEDRVIIRGVVIGLVRPRLSAATRLAS